ncbi:MAG: class I SAM-dependent methyltransferase [Planctomycetota bacterium]|jgi:SAM-dependent methyltransferase
MADVKRGKWEKAYRRFIRMGKGVPWDTQGPSLDLVRFLETTNMKQVCSVLDVGCGTGINAVYLASKGFKVTGVDISRTAISMAIDRTKGDAHCDFLVADVFQLPFDADTFDLVYDRGCFHNLSRSERNLYIESIKRVLKKDGLLLLSCLSKGNCNRYWVWIIRSIGKIRRITKGVCLYPTLMSEKDVRRIFSSDFEILRVLELEVPFSHHKPRLFLTCLLKNIG